MTIRLTLAELSTYPVVGKFSTGDSVTITIYDPYSSAEVSLSEDSGSNECAEISDSGLFVWNFSKLLAQPTALGKYVWTMTSGTVEQSGEVVFGGYVEQIPEVLPDASICKVYLSIYEPNAGDTIEPNRLFDEEAYAKITGANYQENRYYTTEKRKPSYDKLTGEAYWLLPQGVTVKFVIPQLDISSTVSIPASETVELYDLISA